MVKDGGVVECQSEGLDGMIVFRLVALLQFLGQFLLLRDGPNNGLI